MADRVGSWGAEKLLLLGSLSWSLIVKLPQRLWRIVLDVWHAVVGVAGCLRPGLTGAVSTTARTWLRDGLLGGSVWTGRLLLRLVELAGLGEVL